MNITKAELVNSLCATVKIGRNDAKILVENFFEQICVALSSGTDVKISGFGNFTMRNKSERPGRNPRTGEEVVITRRRVVTFKQGQALKRTTNAQIEIIGA